MKKLAALILALLLTLSLCACGSNSYETVAAPAAAYDMAMTEEAAEMESVGFASEDTALTAGSGSLNTDKIIYSAEATIETTDFDKCVEELTALVGEYGGFVESSSINGNNYYSQSRGYASSRSAHYQLRIPSAHFSTLMGSLSTLGNVPYSNTYTENVTSRYYDTEARLTAYEAQETRLLEMLEMAESIEDIITIEEKLTDLRYSIESLQSTLNNWDRQVSYSSVYLSIEEVHEYTPEADLTYGQELVLALKSGFNNAVDFLKGLLVFLVGALPAIIVIAVLAVVIVPIVKKRRARKAAKKAQAQE